MDDAPPEDGKSGNVATLQRDQAPDDCRRCLITNRPAAIQPYYLVSQSTDRETLTKLEYVWEIGYRRFHFDAKQNVLHLRADWQVLFDDSRWMLVPQVEVIEQLKKIYITDARQTCDLAKHFDEYQTFDYHVLPTPSMRETICRFPNVHTYDHTSHAPPFPDLGPLPSHVHPHHVIFNTGQKMGDLRRGEVVQMRLFLSRILSVSVQDAKSTLDGIYELYRRWTKTRMPPVARWCQCPRSDAHAPRDRDQNRRGGDVQQTMSAVPALAPQDGDASSVTVGADAEDEEDTTWIEYIRNWQKQGQGTTDKERLLDTPEDSESSDACADRQLAAYVDEHARTPPLQDAWDSWKPTWDDHCRLSGYPPSASARSMFSSNDWAVFKNDVYLTRSEHISVWTGAPGMCEREV